MWVSPGHILHPFLLALHTNLAADVAKLGVSRAHAGGIGAVTGCICHEMHIVQFIDEMG